MTYILVRANLYRSSFIGFHMWASLSESPVVNGAKWDDKQCSRLLIADVLTHNSKSTCVSYNNNGGLSLLKCL